VLAVFEVLEYLQHSFYERHRAILSRHCPVEVHATYRRLSVSIRGQETIKPPALRNRRGLWNGPTFFDRAVLLVCYELTAP